MRRLKAVIYIFLLFMCSLTVAQSEKVAVEADAKATPG